MIEIIKETLNELKSIKIDIQDDKEKIDNSIKNLEFIVKEYKRLIDDFIENSANKIGSKSWSISVSFSNSNSALQYQQFINQSSLME